MSDTPRQNTNSAPRLQTRCGICFSYEMHKPSAHLYAFLPKHFWRKILVIWPNHRPALNPCQIKIVHILQATIAKITKQGVRGSDRNGGVKVVGLGTNHRLSLAQNPVLLAGQIAIILASCNRDVARLRKRRQVAALVGLEVAQRPHGVHYTIISHNPTTRTPPLGSQPHHPNPTIRV